MNTHIVHSHSVFCVSESLDTDYDSRDMEMVQSNDKFLECFLHTCPTLEEVTQDMDLTLKLRKEYTLNGNYMTTVWYQITNKQIFM